MKTTLWSRSKLETANTNRDGSGTIIFVGRAETASWLDRVIYQSLGDNAVCVGRLFVRSDDTDAAVDYFLLAETTLSAKSTSQTAAIAADEDLIGVYLAAGSRLYACVSQDLTGSSGYHVGVALSDSRQEMEAL